MEKYLPLIIAVFSLTVGVANTIYARRRDVTKDTAADEKRITEIQDKLNDACDDVEKLERKLDQLSARVVEAETKLKVLDKQMDLFWGTVQRHMANLIAPDK